MTKKDHCPICRRPVPGGHWCTSCKRSYDRTAHRDGSVLEAIAWAANRAWEAAKKDTCTGCGAPNCSHLWPEQKKCCPDCSHKEKK